MEYHIKRMSDSAKYFEILLDAQKLKKILIEEVPNFSGEAYKVRIAANKSGEVKIVILPPNVSEQGDIIRLNFAKTPVDFNNPLLYHKTTDRRLYAEADERPSGLDDIIFMNNKGEVTETSIYNIVVKIKDDLFTPHVASGLLRGTFRAYLLDTGKIEEMIISKRDLQNCDELFVINSVRKWRKAILAES